MNQAWPFILRNLSPILLWREQRTMMIKTTSLQGPCCICLYNIKIKKIYFTGFILLILYEIMIWTLSFVLSYSPCKHKNISSRLKTWTDWYIPRLRQCLLYFCLAIYPVKNISLACLTSLGTSERSSKVIIIKTAKPSPLSITVQMGSQCRSVVVLK